MTAANNAEPLPEHADIVFATVNALDPCCWRLLGQFLRSPTGVIERGTTTVAAELGWPTPLVTEHAEHLHAAGLIEVERPPYSRVIYYVTWCDDCPDPRQDDRVYMDGVDW